MRSSLHSPLRPGAQAADFVGTDRRQDEGRTRLDAVGTRTNGSFFRGDEIVGLTLRRSFLGGRGEEQHALRAHSEAAD